MVQRFLTKVEKDKNSDKHFLDSKLSGFQIIANIHFHYIQIFKKKFNKKQIKCN